jgi:hypothetical protein
MDHAGRTDLHHRTHPVPHLRMTPDPPVTGALSVRRRLASLTEPLVIHYYDEVLCSPGITGERGSAG